MTDKIKKNLLITLDFPPRPGGVARYLSNICKQLPPDKITVLAPPGGENFDQKQNYKIYRKKLLFKHFWPHWTLIFWPAYKIIKKEHIEKLQLSQVLPIGYLALMFKIFFKLPYLVYTHGLDIKSPQSSRWKYYWLKKILCLAEIVVANSNFTKKELLKIGVSENKIKVVYPCINPNDYPKPLPEDIQKIKKKYNLEGKRIILTLGRLVERKGQDIIIKALPDILKKIPDTVYLIVGEGPHEDSLKQLVRQNNLEKAVFFIGQATTEELPLYYSLCDIFAMPARELADGDVEGFGIVFIEAGIFGKPAIAGRSGGMSEAVRDQESGFIVEGKNKEEVSEKIIFLLINDKLRAEFSKKAREISRNYFCKNQLESLKELLT